MATKEQTRTSVPENADTIAVNIRDHELQQTLNDFLEEDQQKEAKPSVIMNVANAVGLGFLATGALHILRQLPFLGFLPDVTGAIEVFPVLGALFIFLLGFGFFTYERKLIKQEKKRKKTAATAQDLFGDRKTGGLGNMLDQSGLADKTTAQPLDAYALKHRKRLYKSVINKKIFGVCGGLAKYLGIEPTVIRFIFAIATVLGYGSSIIVYLALAIALSKEPAELQRSNPFDE
jgi:phage shock protein C